MQKLLEEREKALKASSDDAAGMKTQYDQIVTHSRRQSEYIAILNRDLIQAQVCETYNTPACTVQVLRTCRYMYHNVRIVTHAQLAKQSFPPHTINVHDNKEGLEPRLLKCLQVNEKSFDFKRGNIGMV